MPELLSFFVVLFAGVFFSAVFSRFRIPWVITLIIGGMLIGPHGFGFLEVTSTVDFLGQIGLVFLMFIAGLETKLSSFLEYKRGVATISALNGVLPFFAGLAIGIIFGYSLAASFLLGIVFISSSIAVALPTFEAYGLFKKSIGKTIVSAIMVEDIASLLLLSVFLQKFSPATALPLPFFLILLVLIIAGAKLLVPRVHAFFKSRFFNKKKRGISKKDIFEQDVRTVLVILVGSILLFEALGVHPIVAGFLSGLFLSEIMHSQALLQKLHVLSYGLFVPIFFIVVGAETDIGVFVRLQGAALLTVAVVLGSMTIKFVSGYLGARLSKFKPKNGLLTGVATMPQLSTTLAVVFTGFHLGFLDQKMVTAMIILSVVTVFVGQVAVSAIARGRRIPAG